MNLLLEIKNLTVSYKDIIAVNKVSLAIKTGEIISIVGESGSGKSTVIRSILRLLSENASIDDGEIYFMGKNILKLNEKEFQKIRGKNIAMMFQDAGNSMDPIKTIESQFVEYIQTHNNISKKNARDIAKDWLEKMKLSESERVLKSYPFELSGGMKQRVVLAMVMAQKPQLLLADEPTSALDVTVQAEVIKELKKIRSNYNTSIIMVTHNMALASYISDEIAVMKNAKIVEFGTKNEIIYNPKNEYTKSLLAAVLSLK